VVGNCLELAGTSSTPAEIFGPVPISPLGDNSNQPSYTVRNRFSNPVAGNILMCGIGRQSLLFNNFEAHPVYLDGNNLNLTGTLIPFVPSPDGWNTFQLSYGPVGGLRISVNGIVLITQAPNREAYQLPRNFLRISCAANSGVMRIRDVSIRDRESV
jgi:hypothetical protein